MTVSYKDTVKIVFDSIIDAAGDLESRNLKAGMFVHRSNMDTGTFTFRIDFLPLYAYKPCKQVTNKEFKSIVDKAMKNIKRNTSLADDFRKLDYLIVIDNNLNRYVTFSFEKIPPVEKAYLRHQLPKEIKDEIAQIYLEKLKNIVSEPIPF